MPSHSETPLSIRFGAAAFAIWVIVSAAPIVAHHESRISYDLSKTVQLEEHYRRVNAKTIEVTMTLTDPQVYTAPWASDTITLTRAEATTRMREDVCVPSVEARYKEVIRNPAGGVVVNPK